MNYYFCGFYRCVNSGWHKALLFSDCEWFAGVYTSIKSTEIKYIPIIYSNVSLTSNEKKGSNAGPQKQHPETKSGINEPWHQPVCDHSNVHALPSSQYFQLFVSSLHYTSEQQRLWRMRSLDRAFAVRLCDIKEPFSHGLTQHAQITKYTERKKKRNTKFEIESQNNLYTNLDIFSHLFHHMKV